MGKKVKILVEFEVTPTESLDSEFTENVAKSAASQAVYDFLSFCTVSGVNTDTDEVIVHVDGFGECVVCIGDDHE